MKSTPLAPEALTSPAHALRSRLLALIENTPGPGNAALTLALETWWIEQQAWESELACLLEAHHEINNALVGVRGHAQLLMLGPAGTDPRIRERLEVIIRESGRIEKAAQQLREIRSRLAATGSEWSGSASVPRWP